VLKPSTANVFFRTLAKDTIRTVAAERNVRYLKVEPAVERLNRPWLMIHGGDDTYIKPEMAHSLHQRAAKSGLSELWMVDNAKHNQAMHVAGEEYHRKLVEFFDETPRERFRTEIENRPHAEPQPRPK